MTCSWSHSMYQKQDLNSGPLDSISEWLYVILSLSWKSRVTFYQLAPVSCFIFHSHCCEAQPDLEDPSDVPGTPEAGMGTQVFCTLSKPGKWSFWGIHSILCLPDRGQGCPPSSQPPTQIQSLLERVAPHLPIIDPLSLVPGFYLKYIPCSSVVVCPLYSASSLIWKPYG